MKTKKEILQETINVYSDGSKRSLAGAACAYLAPNGNKCAVGRCLTDKGLKKAHKHEGSSVYGLLGIMGDDVFKPEYRGHDFDFWNLLQALHDGNHWDNGLTEVGVIFVKKICKKFDIPFKEIRCEKT